jgi:predicted phosphodiesterase
VEAHLRNNGTRISRRTLQRRAKEFGLSYNKTKKAYHHLTQLAAADHEQKKYNSFLEVSGDALILSDFHIPFFSLDWLNKANKIAENYDIKKCIVAGDFFDAKSISSFGCQDKQHTLLLEMTTAREVFNHFLDRFNEIYFIQGNHDVRLPRYFDYQFDLKFFFDYVCPDMKIKISEFDYCIHTDTNTRICHPRNHSIIPGKIPRDLCSKYLSNIVMGHTHRYCFTFDRSNTFVAMECGGVYDRTKIDYYALHSSTAPAWNNGFALILDKTITGFNEHTPDKFFE